MFKMNILFSGLNLYVGHFEALYVWTLMLECPYMISVLYFISTKFVRFHFFRCIVVFPSIVPSGVHCLEIILVHMFCYLEYPSLDY